MIDYDLKDVIVRGGIASGLGIAGATYFGVSTVLVDEVSRLKGRYMVVGLSYSIQNVNGTLEGAVVTQYGPPLFTANVTEIVTNHNSSSNGVAVGTILKFDNANDGVAGLGFTIVIHCNKIVVGASFEVAIRYFVSLIPVA